VIVQAGGFGEHRFEAVTYDVCTSDYPGSNKTYAPPPITTRSETVDLADRHLLVMLPPGTQITLTLAVKRYVNQPTYDLP